MILYQRDVNILIIGHVFLIYHSYVLYVTRHLIELLCYLPGIRNINNLNVSLSFSNTPLIPYTEYAALFPWL